MSRTLVVLLTMSLLHPAHGAEGDRAPVGRAAADAAVMALPPGELWKVCLQNKT